MTAAGPGLEASDQDASGHDDAVRLRPGVQRRLYEQLARFSGRSWNLSLAQIVLSPTALEDLPDLLAGSSVVLLVCDDIEAQHPARIRLVVAQTENSVCAFTSSMSVITVDGVKSTVPSRLPDALVLDTSVLAEAPPAYSMGGIGDASVAAASFGAYRLSHLLGLSDWQPLSWELMRQPRHRFLSRDPVLADHGPAGTGATAMDLAPADWR